MNTTDDAMDVRAAQGKPWARWGLLGLLACACVLAGKRGYQQVAGFGFTPEYLNIARTSLATGRYSRTADPALTGTTGNVVVDELQREPLYPAAVMLMEKLAGDAQPLIWVQLLAMVLAVALLGEIARRHGGWGAAGVFFVLFLMAPMPHFFSEVLFPYAFQFLLISVAMFALSSCSPSFAISFSRLACEARPMGLESEDAPSAVGRASQARRLNESAGDSQPNISRPWPLFLAGAALALASYERGAYLALPAFVAGAMWLVRRRAGLTFKQVRGFLAVATLVQLPWLVRNVSHGVVGMNAMTGYTLGFTYGNLPPMPRNAAEREYEKLVRNREIGTDVGTQRFIWGRTARGQGTLVENDRLVTRYVIHAAMTHKLIVLKRILKSASDFPARLCRPSLDFLRSPEHRPIHYFHDYLNNLPATPADWALFVFALVGLGLIARRAPILGAAMIATCVYTLLFSTTIVKFDPRYRGVVDGILVMCAAVALARIAIAVTMRARHRA